MQTDNCIERKHGFSELTNYTSIPHRYNIPLIICVRPRAYLWMEGFAFQNSLIDDKTYA